MRLIDRRLSAAFFAAIIATASAFPNAQAKPLFTFHSNAWLNLHHYVRAVARGGPGPAGLTAEEQKQWTAGVDFYKPRPGMCCAMMGWSRSPARCVAPRAETLLRASPLTGS